MRIAQPKPFFFERGKACSITCSMDLQELRRMFGCLGRFLEKKGYTSLAPHYKGHGVPPEELIHTGPERVVGRCSCGL